MSKRFFTSDWHLGSTNILKYAKRPFISAGDAAAKLVDACNEVAKKEDVVFHVGDFWLRGADRHDTVVDENNLTATSDDYLRFISSRFVLLEGNHDASNVESDIKNMRLDLNQNYKNVYVSHFPSYHQYYCGPDCSKWTFGRGIVLCGHVHDSWKVMFDAKKNVLNVNVGIDVWNYRPVEDVQITELLDFMKCLLKSVPRSKDNNYWTQDILERDKLAYRKMLEAQRKEHKAERYTRKGLTPEECQRRKEAAMKAKGLDPNFKKAKKAKKQVEDAFTHEDAVQFGFVSPNTMNIFS